jgi:hypothetical protein
MKLLEQMKGTGIVTGPDGDEMEAKYDLQITQDELEAEPDAIPIMRSKHISGLVWSTSDPSFVSKHCRKIMTLQIDDGRIFRLFHSGYRRKYWIEQVAGVKTLPRRVGVQILKALDGPWTLV